MAIIFYPSVGDGLENKSHFALADRIALLAEAAEAYKAMVFGKREEKHREKKHSTAATLPNTSAVAFNWEVMAVILQETHSLSEDTKAEKIDKIAYLEKIIDVYEVLRGAEMPDLNMVIQQLRDEIARLSR